WPGKSLLRGCSRSWLRSTARASRPRRSRLQSRLARADCADGEELVDAVTVVAERAKYFARVFPHHDGRALDAAGGCVEVEDQAGDIHATDEALFVRRDPTFLDELGIVEHRQHKVGVGDLAGDSGRVEDVEPFTRGARRHFTAGQERE